MLAGRFRYATGYVRGFVSGVLGDRPAPNKTDAPVPASAPMVEPEPLPDDPEALLQWAEHQMRSAQAKNRERAVAAITAKNTLQARVEQTEKIVASLREKADLARLFGDHEMSRRLRAEQEAYEKTLAGMRASLTSATETVERVKVAIRREEERIRARTAQAMALRTQWKERQILQAMGEAAGALDPESSLAVLRAEVQALVSLIGRTDGDLRRLAEQAMRDGDRSRAALILAERCVLQNALAQ